MVQVPEVVDPPAKGDQGTPTTVEPPDPVGEELEHRLATGLVDSAQLEQGLGALTPHPAEVGQDLDPHLGMVVHGLEDLLALLGAAHEGLSLLLGGHRDVVWLIIKHMLNQFYIFS